LLQIFAQDVFEVLLIAGAVVGGADDTGHGSVPNWRQSGEAVEEDTAAPAAAIIVIIVAGDAEGSVREDESRKLAHVIMRGGVPHAAYSAETCAVGGER
jgi:hypothetical protein